MLIDFVMDLFGWILKPLTLPFVGVWVLLRGLLVNLAPFAMLAALVGIAYCYAVALVKIVG
jgi:hypothetical protein